MTKDLYLEFRTLVPHPTIFDHICKTRISHVTNGCSLSSVFPPTPVLLLRAWTDIADTPMRMFSPVNAPLTMISACLQLVHYYHGKGFVSFTGEKRGINGPLSPPRCSRVGDTKTLPPPVPLPGLVHDEHAFRPFFHPSRLVAVPSAACSKNLRRFVRARISLPDASSLSVSSSLLIAG